MIRHLGAFVAIGALAAAVACQGAPPASTFELQCRLDPVLVRLARPDLPGGAPTVRLLLGSVGEPLAAEVGRLTIDLLPWNGDAVLATREVAPTPPVRLVAPGAGLETPTVVPLPLYDEAAGRVLAAGSERLYKFRFAVAADFSAAQGPVAPVVPAHRRRSYNFVTVELVPGPGASATPAATPCVVTPGPNDPNGTPAPCPTPTTTLRPTGSPTP